MIRFLSARRFWVVAGSLLLINVGGLFWIRSAALERAERKVAVLRVLPERDFEKADRLSLLLDKPVASEDLVGRILDRSPFLLSPTAAGHWEWAARNRLEYRLEKPLLPGRTYEMRPAHDFEQVTSYRLVGFERFVFKTRSLSLHSCDLEAADRENVTFALRFNQPVDPHEALRHLEVRASKNGALLEVVPLSVKPAPSLSFQVPRGQAERLIVRVERTLTGVGGELELGQDQLRLLHLPRSFALLRAWVDTPGLEEGLRVRLHFSSPLNSSQTVPEIELVPQVDSVRARFDYYDLVLEGPFECRERYAVKVAPGLLAENGSLLGEHNAVTFEVPDREPTLRIPLSNGILSPAGNLAIAVESVNVPAIEITAARVYENNLVAHVHGDGSWRTSRSLHPQNVRLGGVHNVPHTASLSLPEILGDQMGSPAPLGIFRVTVSATDSYWTSDSALVTVSDLAITVKRERGGLFAWVSSVRTAEALGGVHLQAFSRTNQVLAEAVTEADGTARLTLDPNDPDGDPFVIAARLGNDLNYIQPDRRSWVLDDVDTWGRDVPATYDVMLYTERGAYRPGEVIHLTGIVRDAWGATPPSFPLSVTVTRPDGRRSGEFSVRPDRERQGLFHLDIPSDAEGQTGRYTIRATLPGSGDVLGETAALVEAFVPVRLEVGAQPLQPAFAAGEAVRVDVHARYLFDQPATDLPVTVTGSYRPRAFRSRAFPEFDFGGGGIGETLPIEPVKGKLDEQGRVELVFPRPERPKGENVTGLWEASLVATVAEPGGRSVSKHLATMVDQSGRHVGLYLPLGRVLPTNELLELQWVVCSLDDTLAEPGDLELSLVHVAYEDLWQVIDGEYVWKTRERVTPVTTRVVSASGLAEARGVLGFECAAEGSYRLGLKDLVSGNSARLEFHASSVTGGRQTLALRRPGRLELLFDEPRHLPGQTAELLVRSPFPGTLLLTVETDRVVSHRLLELTSTEATIELPVASDLRGGAFVTGTVVRAVDPTRGSWLPVRAMGIARLVIDHGSHRLEPLIEADERAPPGSVMQVTVSIGGPVSTAHPAIVHLWAVDEGVLLCTGFETPSPFDHFLAPRRLEVTTADLYADLLPDLRPQVVAHVGGDESEDAAGLRRGPVSGKRRACAVVWSESRPVRADGRASFEMAMPEMTGEMRLMAVVVDGDRYGSAERAMTLTAPLLVEAAWPRFVAPGDRFEVPLKVFNSSERVLEVEIDLEVEGPVQLDAPPRNATVEPGHPACLVVHAEATGLGEIAVRTHVTARLDASEELRASQEDHFVSRPPFPLHSVSRVLALEAGQSLLLETPPELEPKSTRLSLSVGGSPLVDLRPAIERLIDYPYGCIEQTTSRLWTLLAAPEVIPQEDSAAGLRDLVGELMAAGIARLHSMQTSSGGLSYWPGEGRSHLWGTIYAASFLAQARRAGIELDASFIGALLDYLEKALERSATSSSQDAVDDNMRALLCHVLAAFGRGPTGWMARLTENVKALDIGGRAHLAGAWLEAGRADRAWSALPDDTISHPVTLSTGGRIMSQVSEEAALLFVLLELDTNHAWIPVLVKRLDDARPCGYWGTTLENAMALAALARYQALQPRGAEFTGIIRAEGIERSFDNTMMRNVRLPRGCGRVEIASEGEGTVHIALVAEGLLREGASDAYDRNLTVRRRWLDGKGAPLDPAKVKAGSLVQVEIMLHAPQLASGAEVANVAIVDALPAGLEVENPRLATSATAFATASAEPDRVEFLDDRVLLFGSASCHKQTFRYALRVVTVGDFVLPPIQASCMYDPGYASVSSGGRVEVRL
ncbi:MAG: MG2 domain-containing protein [Planctomycetota bacterium]